MSRLIDLSGKRFGKLTVVSRYGSTKNGSGTTPTWFAMCDCGNDSIVRGTALRAGDTTSCGCAGHHGMYGTPEYNAWGSMIRRCYVKTTVRYERYGARGISVCDEWRRDFAAFYRHIGPRPSPDYSLDRIDNNGNYEPGNVRWATLKQQARNKSNNHKITAGGTTATIAEFAEATGIGKTTIKERLRRGWSPSRAVGLVASR